MGMDMIDLLGLDPGSDYQKYMKEMQQRMARKTFLNYLLLKWARFIFPEEFEVIVSDW